MGNNLIVIPSKNTAKLWVLTRSFRQYIIRSLTGLSKEQMDEIFSGIKTCLFNQKKGKWTDELPKVIWSHNTTVSRATGFTPFHLLFGTEAMTPKEIKNESMRVLKGKEIEEVDQKVEKDMIELTILEAAENIEKYQKETKTWKDRKVVRKDIKAGDLVLK
jgi:hypothetical protein